MRYLIASSLLLLLLLPTLPARAGEPAQPGFSEWALRQGEALDRDWNDAVGSISGISTGSVHSFKVTRGRISSPAKRTRHRFGRGSWNGTVNSAGFIHSGISSEFLPLSTRTRNGPSRGVNKLESPAQARLSGIRRKPFNSMNFDRSFSSGHRGSSRKSPAMGTRRSQSSRRSGASSIGSIGSTRTRRRR